MADTCDLRPFQPGDGALLSALALRSKAWWGYDDAFMARCRDELTWTDAELAALPGAVATDGPDGAPLGFAVLEPRDTHWELDALFVDPPAMGRGIGRALFDQAMAQARQGGAPGVEIQADPGAEAFYRRCGARRVGSRPSASIPGRDLPLLEVTIP